MQRPRGIQYSPQVHSRLASHHLDVWMQTYCPRCPICPQPEHGLTYLMMTHWFCLASSILAKARLAIAKRCLVRQVTRCHCLRQLVSTVPRLPGAGEKGISVQPAVSADHPSAPVRATVASRTGLCRAWGEIELSRGFLTLSPLNSWLKGI